MIPLSYGLILSSILFILGFIGLIIRNNFFYILLSLEIMFNSSALVFILSSHYWCQLNGQILYILTITLAAVEACIGLSLLIKLNKIKNNLDINKINEMNNL